MGSPIYSVIEWLADKIHIPKLNFTNNGSLLYL